MNFRVRAAAIILNDTEELLMVLHRHPKTGDEWWTLPGGGLEPTENAMDAVGREVCEECNIHCIPDRLVYVREFLDEENSIHHVELFFTAKAVDYNIHKGIDPELQEQFITECRFLSKKDIINTSVAVYPEVLRNRFWQDKDNGFYGHAAYLGLQK